MAEETGYRRRVAPQATAPLPQASAESYGGGLGRAMGQLGGEMHRAQLTSYQLQRKREAEDQWAQFQHGYAQHRQNMDGIVREMRKDGSAGHAERAATAWEAARAGLLDGLTEDSVRRQATQMFDEGELRLRMGEVDFEEVGRVKRTLDNWGATQDIQLNRIRRLERPDDYLQEIEIGHQGIEALDISSDAKTAALREFDNGAAISFLQGRTDADPAFALALIDSGKFDDVLEPKQVDALRAGAQVEIRREQAQVEHQASLEKAAAREEIQTAQELSSQGIDVSEQLPDLIAKASAMGDTSTVAKLEGLARDSAFAKVWGAVSPLQRQARLQALQAIPEAKRTQSDQAELKWLIDKGGSLDGQFNSDPVGFAARTAPQGMGPPPLSDYSPAELAQREKWMRQAQGAYGSMKPLSAAEATALREQAEAGDKGLREVVSTVSGFTPKVAAQAMRQILPNDTFIQNVVALPSDNRTRALHGREVLKANSKILDTPKDDDDAKREVAGLQAGFGLAVGNLPPDQRNGIMEVAKAIAAESLGRQGLLSEHNSSAIMAWALDRALGAEGTGSAKKGGLGWWGSKIYLLPSGMSQAGFDDHISRYLRDHPDDLPVNPDGSAVDLRKARPQAMSGGRYKFMVGGRDVLGKDGKTWVRTVAAK